MLIKRLPQVLLRRHLHKSKQQIDFLKPNLNANKFAESHNEIQQNITRRKGIGNIKLIQDLLEKINNGQLPENEERQIQIELQNELNKLPNATHPDVLAYGDEPNVVQKFGDKPQFSFKPKPFADIAKFFNVLRMEHLGNFTGTKSYYLMSDLAELVRFDKQDVLQRKYWKSFQLQEQALIQYTTSALKKHGFKLMSVPDILPEATIEGCGMTTQGDRTQVTYFTKTCFVK